jgi:DnaJ-class molecular chaperone
MKDYHGILRVRRDATLTEIKRAYRKLALQYHPDRNKAPDAAERFREISEAYAVLSGKEKAPAPTIGPQTRNPGPKAGYRGRGSGADMDVAWGQGIMEKRYDNMYR